MFQGLLNMQNPVEESGKIVSLILRRHSCTKQLKDIVHRGYLQLIYSSTMLAPPCIENHTIVTTLSFYHSLKSLSIILELSFFHKKYSNTLSVLSIIWHR